MSKDGKRKWEREYEELKTKNFDEEIKKLQADLEAANNMEVKGSNPDEYRKAAVDKDKNTKELSEKLEKMKIIKENMPQIASTLKFRDAQKARLQKLLEQKTKAEEAKKSSEQTTKLEDEAKKLEERLQKLKEAERVIRDGLKSPNLSDEDRAKKEEALRNNIKFQNENQLAFAENREKFGKAQEVLSNAMRSSLLKRNFDREIQATKNMISKANFTGRNLVAGRKMEDITVDLKKWEDREYTDKKGEAHKKVEASKPEKTPVTKAGEEPPKKFGEVPHELKGDEPDKPEENKPEDKPSRFAKVKNFFKKAYDSVRNRFSNKNRALAAGEKPEDAKPAETKPAEKKDNGKLTAEQIADKKARFYARLAETGRKSDTPAESKMTEALKQQEETVKRIQNNDEGR